MCGLWNSICDPIPTYLMSFPTCHHARGSTMANTTTTTSSVVDHKARLEAELTRLDKQVHEKRREIECLQEELNDLEVERSDLLDELDDEED
jgi:uncharacterized protein YlxW (UPF0749 family)